jgi:hypothetical protein
MKTTVEIAVVEYSLRNDLSHPPTGESGFRLQHSAFGGPETAPTLPSWPEVRDVIYNLPPDAESK